VVVPSAPVPCPVAHAGLSHVALRHTKCAERCDCYGVEDDSLCSHTTALLLILWFRRVTNGLESIDLPGVALPTYGLLVGNSGRRRALLSVGEGARSDRLLSPPGVEDVTRIVLGGVAIGAASSAAAFWAGGVIARSGRCSGRSAAYRSRAPLKRSLRRAHIWSTCRN